MSVVHVCGSVMTFRLNSTKCIFQLFPICSKRHRELSKLLFYICNYIICVNIYLIKLIQIVDRLYQ